MLELFLLEYYKGNAGYTILEINRNKYMERLNILRDEFLSQYANDSTSRE